MLRDGLVGAFMLLTRLPVGRWARPGATGGAWAWPVVGLAAGAIGGAAYAVLLRLGCPPLLGAIWTLAVLILLTGGLHEDGLADTADGFGGGATAARKLEIMRDSRIGSFGALALLLAVTARGAAIAAIGQPGAVLAALVIAGAVGRAAMILPSTLSPAARTDGMAARLPKMPPREAAAGLGIAVVAAATLAPGATALAVLLAAGAAAWGMTALAKRQIGGHTGDVLGATEIVVECVVLSVLAAMAG